LDIEIKLDPKYKILKAVIFTDKMTDEINAAAKRLSENSQQVITGFRDNILRILKDDEIVRIYASNGKIIAATTDNGEYFLHHRLYEIEECLEPTKFVRISNSEIINLNKVKHFDLNFVGTICVTLSDSTTTYVSRRYVSKIKRILGV